MVISIMESRCSVVDYCKLYHVTNTYIITSCALGALIWINESNKFELNNIINNKIIYNDAIILIE